MRKRKTTFFDETRIWPRVLRKYRLLQPRLQTFPPETSDSRAIDLKWKRRGEVSVRWVQDVYVRCDCVTSASYRGTTGQLYLGPQKLLEWIWWVNWLKCRLFYRISKYWHIQLTTKLFSKLIYNVYFIYSLLVVLFYFSVLNGLFDATFT